MFVFSQNTLKFYVVLIYYICLINHWHVGAWERVPANQMETLEKCAPFFINVTKVSE